MVFFTWFNFPSSRNGRSWQENYALKLGVVPKGSGNQEIQLQKCQVLLQFSMLERNHIMSVDFSSENQETNERSQIYAFV